MTSFRLTAEAASDLTEIFDYVAAEGSIDAALRLAAEIEGEIQRLARNPRIGHTREDLTSRDLLFWPVYSYLIIYQASSPVNIIAVLHGRRDVEKVLKHRE